MRSADLQVERSDKTGVFQCYQWRLYIVVSHYDTISDYQRMEYFLSEGLNFHEPLIDWFIITFYYLENLEPQL